MGVGVDGRAEAFVLAEALLAQPIATVQAVPAGAQLSLAAYAHVAALVAADAGAGVRRIELVAPVLGVVIVAGLVAAGRATGVYVGP